MKKATLLVLGCASLLAACGDDSATTPPPATTGQITLTGTTSFNGPHAGQAIRAALVRASDGVVLDIRAGTVAATGTSPAFSFTFAPSVDLGVAYKLRYWVDFNSNGTCDAPPTDHQWEVDAPAGQATVSVTHNTTFTSVCSTFITTGQITLTGTTSFNGPHAGQAIRAALVRPSDGVVLDIQSGTVAATGTSPAFSFTFAPSVDLGVAYKIRYWADHNSNGACDAPPTDHQWEVDAPAGQATVSVTHNTTFTSVCTTFTFPLTFVGSTTFNGPHAGNAFKAALVRGTSTTALEINSGTVAATGTNPAFSVTFVPRLVIGEAYSVKLWMDFNSNATCDAPPTDHQWSVPIPTDFATYQPTVTYVHNTTFTSVCAWLP